MHKLINSYQQNCDLTKELEKKIFKLYQSENRYKALVEDITVFLCRFLPNGTISFINKAYCDYLNIDRELAVGIDFFKLIPEENIEKFRNELEKLNKYNPIRTYTDEISDEKGEKKWIQWTQRALLNECGELFEYQAIGNDITNIMLAEQENKKLQQWLNQSQKLESIGILAGGMAHEFNNILGTIMGFAEIALNRQITENSPTYYFLNQILKASNRAKDIIRQILTFSRQDEEVYENINLTSIVSETLKTIHLSIPENIQIKCKIDNDLYIMANPTQIHQILLNLYSNASHAMKGKKEGILEITLENIIIDKENSFYIEALPGVYAKLTITDNGHGIEPSIIDKIFDPFFTTKKPGEGSGLGLSVIHGIVKKNRGIIKVESNLGYKTSFNILFPAAPAYKTKIESNFLLPVSTAKYRILCVEDDFSLAETIKEVIKKIGYEPYVLTSSIDALNLFKQNPNNFDLVISDIIMPEMCGDELAREILKIKPEMPIIFCSGYNEILKEITIEDLGVKAFISKPFSINQIKHIINKVMEEKKC